MTMGAAILALLAFQEGESAASLLAQAAELVCDGRYADAARLYRRIAEDFPGSRESAVAERRSGKSAFLGACPMIAHGPSDNRVDVIVLGDGYELGHQRALAKVAEDAPPLFERIEPFREYWSYLNFSRGACVSADDGLDGFGREADTLLGGFTRNTDVGHVGIDGQLVHRVLAEIPESDGIAIVFVKQGLMGTGGDGIAVIGGRDAATTVHEFGHAFAGLGDEYSTHTHYRGPPRHGINISASEDEKAVPWRHWIEARHPSVGVYEGANGQVKNAWRPTAGGCIMNDGEAFCPVCREAIVLRIYSLADPIEGAVPPAPPSGVYEPLLLLEDPLEIRVRVQRPATHDLDGSWWIEPVAAFPEGDAGFHKNEPMRDRRLRGPLAPITAKPTLERGAGKDGELVLRLSRIDTKPGRYKITLRVRDSTELRGERFPWVLKDELGLLESERIWWLEVR